MSDGFYGKAALIMVFLGTVAQATEAWTDVLAVWTMRGWQAAVAGLGASIVILCIFVASVVPDIISAPLSEIRLTFGILLLIVGMRWLRKAILRYTGIIAKRDEKLEFQQITKTLKQPDNATESGFDWFGILTAFRSSFLNGLQIGFMVIALGSAGQAFHEASGGAALALAMIVGIGLLLRRPLIEIPGNRLKFSMGALFSAFGTLWTAEGLGVPWPTSNLTILVLSLTYWAAGWAAVVRGDANRNYISIIPFKTTMP